MHIELRNAVPADAEAIGAVHYQAWMETYTGLISSDFLATRSVEKSVENVQNPPAGTRS